MNHIARETALGVDFGPLDRELKEKGFPSRLRLILQFRAPLPEFFLALGFCLISVILGHLFGLQLVFPSSNALQFTGMSYIVPLSLVIALGLFMVLTKRTMQLAYYLFGAFAYGLILAAHFNVKLWMSIVNPRLWDGFYWQTDQMVRPLIDASFVVHNWVGMVLPAENHLYLFAFLAMFGSSIIVHSMKNFIVFRRVIFTAMLVHALGALSYLIMPAVGPFIYETGVNALETARQEHMYDSYQALMVGGKPWLEGQASHFLLAAVAAMPSLHVASSGVFVYYAWKHERWLGWVYLPLFVFIMFEAIATRWHYVIDVVAGLALTGLAIALTTAIFRPIEAHHAVRR